MASTSNITPNPKPPYSQSSNKSLGVEGLDKWMTEAYLKDIFTASTNTRVFHYSASSFGFVEFDSHKVASKAFVSSTGAIMPKYHGLGERSFRVGIGVEVYSLLALGMAETHHYGKIIGFCKGVSMTFCHFRHLQPQAYRQMHRLQISYRMANGLFRIALRSFRRSGFQSLFSL